MRDPALQHIERPGLGKRFPRFSAYKKKAEKNLSMVDLLLSYPLLCRYAKEGPGFPYNLAGLIEPYGAPKAYLDMGNMGGGAYGAQLMYVALDQGDWLPHFRQYMVWMYWYWRIEFAWFRKYQRAGNIPFGPSTTTCLIVKFFSGYIGELLYLGWIEQAIDLSRSACWALEAGFGSNLHGSAQSQYFLLCLMADWQGWPRPKMSPGTLDDPLLTLLLAHWRTPEPDDLHDLLLALCDRRTQQVDDRQDFSNDLMRWYFPYEILAVFRLREQLGLSNPTLDHLVMKTQMAVLPPPQALYDDPFLQKILQHIRAEWPEVQADYLRLPR